MPSISRDAFNKRYDEAVALLNDGELSAVLEILEQLRHDLATQDYERFLTLNLLAYVHHDQHEANKCYEEASTFWAAARSSGLYSEDTVKHNDAGMIDLYEHVNKANAVSNKSMASDRVVPATESVYDIDMHIVSVERICTPSSAQTQKLSRSGPNSGTSEDHIDLTSCLESSHDAMAGHPDMAPQRFITSGNSRLEMLRKELAELESAGFPADSSLKDTINAINADMPEDEEFDESEALGLLIQLKQEGSGFGLR